MQSASQWRVPLFALLPLLAALDVAAGPTARSSAATFSVDQVAPGVFVHIGKPVALDAPGHDDIANIGFVTGKRCVAVIDTGGSVRIGRELRAAIRQHSSLPVCYVITTHGHVDHVLGNAAFKDDGARFVGHAMLPDALMRSRDLFLRDYAGDLDAPATPAQIIGPDKEVPIGNEMTLDLGGRTLTLHAWPKAHTDSDLTVYDPQTRTLWTGDLLFIRRTPVLDGSLRGWLAAIDSLARMDARHVIPGHGPPTDKLAEALEPERRYLQMLLTDVDAQIARGDSLQQALHAPDPPEKANWLLWDEVHRHNVARVYQELEWE
jgi:quinoprotein relay system zinc metallohydrolase 2